MLGSIEHRFELSVDGVSQLFPLQGPAAFLDFMVKNAKEPGLHLRSSLEAIKRLKKCRKHVLHQIFGLLIIKPQPSGVSVQRTRPLLDDRRKRGSVALAEPCQQIRIIVRRRDQVLIKDTAPPENYTST